MISMQNCCRCVSHLSIFRLSQRAGLRILILVEAMFECECQNAHFVLTASFRWVIGHQYSCYLARTPFAGVGLAARMMVHWEQIRVLYEPTFDVFLYSLNVAYKDHPYCELLWSILGAEIGTATFSSFLAIASGWTLRSYCCAIATDVDDFSILGELGGVFVVTLVAVHQIMYGLVWFV